MNVVTFSNEFPILIKDGLQIQSFDCWTLAVIECWWYIRRFLSIGNTTRTSESNLWTKNFTDPPTAHRDAFLQYWNTSHLSDSSGLVHYHCHHDRDASFNSSCWNMQSLMNNTPCSGRRREIRKAETVAFSAQIWWRRAEWAVGVAGKSLGTDHFERTPWQTQSLFNTILAVKVHYRRYFIENHNQRKGLSPWDLHILLSPTKHIERCALWPSTMLISCTTVRLFRMLSDLCDPLIIACVCARNF